MLQKVLWDVLGMQYVWSAWAFHVILFEQRGFRSLDLISARIQAWNVAVLPAEISKELHNKGRAVDNHLEGLYGFVFLFVARGNLGH